MYPFQNAIHDKCLSHLTIRPRFVGLAARPRAATLPRTATGKAGGSFAVQPGCGFHTPAVLAWSAVCAPRPGRSWCSTGGTGSAGEAGRRAPPKRIGGSLGGVVEHVTIVLAGSSGLSNTSDTRLRCASPTKRGRKAQGAKRQSTGNNRPKKLPRTRDRAGAKVTTTGHCRTRG